MTTRSHARGSLAGGLALAVALARSVASADEPPATPTPSPPTAPAAAPPAPATVSTLGAPSPPPLAAPAPGQPPASPPGATPPTGGHWVFVADPTPPRPAETAKPGPVPVYHGPIYTKANTWDANLEGAFGRYFGDEAKWTGFVRARAGLLIVREPLYTAVGLTYEYSNLSNATFGVQAELLHLDSGAWGQLGGLLDIAGHPGVMAAIGWSLFGVEAQVRTYDALGSGVAIYAKVRIPIGVMAYTLGPRYKNTHKPPPAP